jgi:hypothetical protein
MGVPKSKAEDLLGLDTVDFLICGVECRFDELGLEAKSDDDDGVEAISGMTGRSQKAAALLKWQKV